MLCPRCTGPITPESRFCSSCGLSLEETLAATGSGRTPPVTTPVGAVAASSQSPSVSWVSESSGTFAAGTLLLGRYRVVGPLGRGGMGEVVRADDLTLGQAVALKFLPRELASNPERLARFHAEVRIARQVSHPNVCRVYDIGDLGGQPFLSMEFVDGEDLASLLRRIGRLPDDKVAEIARQICAGLAAAHHTGILHRDLKPANVMLDRRGKVRITDFGLAVVQEQARGDERAGTPAYMAPEQLAGRELTIQSDLYALGLVLFEMLTGKRPHRGQTLGELGAERSQLPSRPSTVLEHVDPALERVILRCLEPEPSERPKSAIAVAASLPGGDPLAAALEAGETPSPDMVAAAGAEGRSRPLLAWSLLGGVLAALAVLLLIAPRYYMVNWMPLPKRPAVLEDRATEILRGLGYTEKPGDHASGFDFHTDYLEYVTRHDSSLTRWECLRRDPAALLFWYRESPKHMRPEEFATFRVSYDDPPPLQRGMRRLMLDPSGNLVDLQVVPPEIDSVQVQPAVATGSTTSAQAVAAPALTAPVVTTSATATPAAAAPGIATPSPDPPAAPSLEPSAAQEQQLFTLAGLDAGRFKPAPSVWVPPEYCDVRRAWTRSSVTRPDLSLRLEAGWHAGRLVYFDRIGPWRETEAARPPESTTRRVGGIVSTLLVLSLLVGSVIHARFNLLKGRGDWRSATRLALFIMALHLLTWICVANHAASLREEFDMAIESLTLTLFLAAFFWVVYVALEPHMRRRWPDLIISWTRLLSGRLRDPLVGRDLLIGALFGVLCVLLDSLDQFLPRWLGIPPHYPQGTQLFALAGIPQALLVAVNTVADSMFGPLATVLLLLGLGRLLRSRLLAAVVVVVVVGLMVSTQLDPTGAHPQITIPIGLALMTVWMLTALRFGVLALVTTAYITNLLDVAPITSDWSLWYAGSGAVALLLTLAIALFGLRCTLSPARNA